MPSVNPNGDPNGPDHEVVVIGAGFSGIGAAIALDRAGFTDLLVVEEGDGVGGAWHWNTYPGVGVDIPSFSYQFSFEKRGDWSRVYAPGEELKAYAEHCVDAYGLRDRIRLRTRVTSGSFDDASDTWVLGLADGSSLRARYIVVATGVLTQPKPPAIAGATAGTTWTAEAPVEVTPEANRRYFERMLARRPRQVFFREACSTANSYYFDAHGDVPLRPALTVETRWEAATYPLESYTYTSTGGAA